MIKTYIENIEGFEYKIENNEGRWCIHMPKDSGFPFPPTLDLFAFGLKLGGDGKIDEANNEVTKEMVTEMLHNILAQVPFGMRVPEEDITAKERMTLDRCMDLVRRVAHVPRVEVSRFLSPRLMSIYCEGCEDPRCVCGNDRYVAISRKALQSFETTLQALVHSCAMRYEGNHEENSPEHARAVSKLFARLALLLAQGES